MSNSTLNLHVFTIDKDDNNQNQDLIEMWHSLDSDYEAGSENWRVDEDLEELGYESQAEKEIKQIDWAEKGYDDVTKIEAVLEMISDGHGDYSYQFQYEVNEGDNSYAVAVAFLT